MDPLTLALFVAGLVLLVVGAEALIRGSSRVAVAVGISPLVVGLTVVAFGTSAPELAVSVRSALSGEVATLAMGNVVGSNIFNILVILGLSSLIAPMLVSQQLIRIDVPLMIATSALVIPLGMDGRIGRLDGLLLFSGIVIYTVWSIRQSRRETREVADEYEKEFGSDSIEGVKAWMVNIGLIVLGIGMLVLGSDWLVDGAVVMARAFGVSDMVIGLTIVAAGTSLPEVATSVIAAIRGERDIAVGNVVGSNLYNILAVLGLAALVGPVGIPVPAEALSFDIPIMVACAIACLPIFFTGHVIERWEGALFISFYIVYLTYIVLDATGHPAMDPLRSAVAWFILPLTSITLVILAVRALRRQ